MVQFDVICDVLGNVGLAADGLLQLCEVLRCVFTMM